jgi:hypothetical protein
MLVAEGLDGICFDIEPSNSPTSAAMQALMNPFIQALYNKLNPAGLGIALYCGGTGLTAGDGAQQITAAYQQYVEWIDIGWYYAGGYWSNSPYSLKNVTAAQEYDAYYNAWVTTGGFSPAKLNMKIGCYTKDGSNNEICHYMDVVADPTLGGISQSQDYYIGSGSINSTYIGISGEPKAVSYTGALSWQNPAFCIQKAQYVLSKGLGGIMIWDLEGDMPSSDSRSVLATVYNTMVPSNFVHGTNHVGSFPVTVAPANLSCQVELWLGPNASTKSATSGLVPFTSTGSAQIQNLTITMPAAGTYNVYINVYANSILVGAFEGASPVTVV